MKSKESFEITKNFNDNSITTTLSSNNKSNNYELLTNKEIIYSTNKSSVPEKYTKNLIEIYLNECLLKDKLKNKIYLRNILYFEKLLKNQKFNIKSKKTYNIEEEEILLKFFIYFNKNIWLLLKKYKTEKNEKTNEEIIHLQNILKIILKIIGISYISGNINDETFELIIKINLNFSLENLSENKENGIEELKHMMFFSETIQIIKIVFNKIFFKEKNFSDKKKNLFKNIIIHITNYILGSIEKNNLNYSNKYFLSENEFRESLLIDLSYIIVKMKSIDISKIFLNLLSTIYSFDFRYVNGMKPFLKLLEPLFLKVNKKKLDEIKNELQLTEFSLNYIDALINKEKQIIEKDNCTLKQGFYIGNTINSLYGDISNLEGDFVLIFGFRIESNRLYDLSLFELYHEDKTQLKFYLNKNRNNSDNYYDFEIKVEKETYQPNIIIQVKRTYIFIIRFIKKNKLLKINYIDHESSLNIEKSQIKKNAIGEFNIHNIKQDNLKFCIGCKRENNFKINFHGFIGDFIILNAKNIKENKEQDLYEKILKLKSDYCVITEIISDNNNLISEDNYYNMKFNYIFNTSKESKEILLDLVKIPELKSNHTINTIISQKYFKLVEYHDDIDYIDSSNYRHYQAKLEKSYSVKFKYIINSKVKSDSLLKKCFNLKSSLFNRYFHTFEMNYSLLEFIKYEGIHYLSLIFEYYYQILSNLSENKNNFDLSNLSSIYKEINSKIIIVINFFNSNIIKTRLYKNNVFETGQFFYQMLLVLFKFLEVEELDVNTFKCINDILSSLCVDLKAKLNNQKVFRFLLLISQKLFEFLINPRLFKEKDKNSFNLDKLNYSFLSLLTFLKNTKIKYLNKVSSIENLKILMSYISLLDTPKEIKNFDVTKKNYISLLILFIQISLFNSLDNKKSQSEKNIIEKSEVVEGPRKSSKKLIVDNMYSHDDENEKNLVIYYFFQKALEYRKNHHIFYNMTLIMVKTNLITMIKEDDIKNIKTLFLQEFHNKESNNSEFKDYKKTLYLSYLKILVSFHFSQSKPEKQDFYENNFNEFIRNNLFLDSDLFYALITLLRQVTSFSNIIRKELNSFESEDLLKIKTNDTPNFSDLPMMEIKLNCLNDIDVRIIKNILLDIIYLLDRLSDKCSKKGKDNHSEKNNNNSFSSQSSDNTTEKEAFETIKKNIDIIFKNPRTNVYETIFNTENNICTKLFLIKWKYGDEKEKDINYIKTVFKKYYKELVTNTYCSFIFKFLMEISTDILFKNEPSEENKETILLNFKSEMIIYIIQTLIKLSKELKFSNDYLPYYMYNIINLLIVINQELNYQPNKLFKNQELCGNLCDFITLVSDGLIYSNYCIMFNNNHGKIISEIIFDLLLALPDEFFHKSFFINILYKDSLRMTVFYIIDRYKEKLIKKNQVFQIKLNELKKLKEYHTILKSENQIIRKKYFVQENELIKIQETNYTMYFLAKCYVYLRSNMLKDKENSLKNSKTEKENDKKEKVMNKFIEYLGNNLYSLYTRYNMFYVSKNCGFPLYDATKKYFESYIIQNYNQKEPKKNSVFYNTFFEHDLLVIIKEEYKLEYCYSSRLLSNKNINQNPSKTEQDELKNKNINKNESNKNEDLLSKNSSDNTSNNKSTNNNSSILNSSFIQKEQFQNNIEENLETPELNKKNSDIQENSIKIFNHSFELIKEKFIFLNPRNFFFKKIFSEAFKDIIFKNKIFIDIKKTYIIKFGQKRGFFKESKQINYPTRQKNYSNSLEPRIFLRRDFNFFDKIYFPISFEYLPKTIINQQEPEMFLYKHHYKFKKEKMKNEIECDMVTSQYILFGKIYFFEKYVIYETQDDPRKNNETNVEIFLKYAISTKGKEKNSIDKNKYIVIFINDIKEAIKRRSLLITQSIEIFLKNGKSYFFNFFKQKEAKKVYDYFEEAKKNYNFIFEKVDNQKEIKNVLSNFHDGKISNYLYISYLNKYATRTFCDLSQYPVFPWLILNRKKMDDIFNYIQNNAELTEELNSEIRDMRYPISMQKEEVREDCIKKFEEEKIEDHFLNHFNSHYSSSAFVYYYLMRLNPYTQNMIKLQNYQNENPNRIFISFENLEAILSMGLDNRELIPDFFCYFDFLLNLNCSFLGQVNDQSINDDFISNIEDSNKYDNTLSSYVYTLYRDKKLLNTTFISKSIHEWVDIIFGKNQLPEDDDALAESCNIYNKLSYEQKINFEKKFEKYENLIKEKKITEKKFFEKMRVKLDVTINFGITPKQILKTTNLYEGENKSINMNQKGFKKNFDEKLIYFEKLPNEEYLILKDINKKDKTSIRTLGLYSYKNKNLSEIKIYECRQLNLMKRYKSLTIDIKNKKKKIPLYNPCYSISYLELKMNKKNKKGMNIIILTCRYLGNYFNIQTFDKNINVTCEDFVTCIKGNSIDNSNIFYTGLFNGKLSKWEINSNLEVNELLHVYSHQESITIIELYNPQNIIITASEDKFIHIRKQYDFDLLTVINLTYCFANPIISKNKNIFPSLIKISDLNLIYVLIYDLDSKSNFIRGYNLNGLFFAQSDKNTFININNKDYFLINSIAFSKNSNLIIGFYNFNQYLSLQSWDLQPKYLFRKFPLNDKKERIGTEMIDYDFSLDIFYLLYDKDFIGKASKEEENLEYF